MRRILSEVLRRKDGVERRNGRAGALRIEFIERSWNTPLGIESLFAAHGSEWDARTGTLEDGRRASGVKTTGADRRRENRWRVQGRAETEIW